MEGCTNLTYFIIKSIKKEKKKKEYKWESKLSKTFHLEDFKKTSHLNPLTHFQKLNQVPSRLDEEKKNNKLIPVPKKELLICWRSNKFHQYLKKSPKTNVKTGQIQAKIYGGTKGWTKQTM